MEHFGVKETYELKGTRLKLDLVQTLNYNMLIELYRRILQS